MPARYLRIEEVVQVFTELGGEAKWSDVEAGITRKRGNSYDPYKDWMNYKTTMFQLVQQHCKVYKKYIGPVLFAQAGKGRFRLLTSSPGVAGSLSH